MSDSAKRACVYTVLIGDYEQLNEQPVALESDLDFLCLTDNHDLTSQTWTIVHVSAPLAEDSARSSRYFKILGDPALADYEQTIYVDNSVQLLKDPAHLLEQLAHAPFVALRHPMHDTLYQEFKVVAAMGLDTPDRLNEQLNVYRNRRPEILEERPARNTILIRQHTDEVARTMRLWMDHVLRYSRRDQLSLNYVLAEAGLPIQHMRVDLRNCEWASWPHTPGRDRGPLTPFELEGHGDGGSGDADGSLETSLAVSLEAEQRSSDVAVAGSPSLRTRVVRLLPRSARRRVKRNQRRRQGGMDVRQEQ